MAYTITFVAERKLAEVAADGSEDFTVALDAMRDLRTDQRFQPDYGILCDLRRQTFVANPIELAGLSLILQKFFAGQRLAFVRADAQGYHAQRQVIAMAGAKVNAMVFRDRVEAENWLLAEGR